jgi:hypothetical protein
VAKTPQRNKKVFSSIEIGDRATTEIHDQFVNYKTGNTTFTTRSWATKTGKDLLAYCQRDSSLRIEPFHYSLGITTRVWEKLWRLYPELEIYLAEAKDVLGDKRLQRGLEKKYDAGMASFALHQYHPDWRAAEEYHDARKTKIAADSSGNPGNTEIHVHMDQIPNSGIVPDKKKEDNE